MRDPTRRDSTLFKKTRRRALSRIRAAALSGEREKKFESCSGKIHCKRSERVKQQQQQQRQQQQQQQQPASERHLFSLFGKNWTPQRARRLPIMQSPYVSNCPVRFRNPPPSLFLSLLSHPLPLWTHTHTFFRPRLREWCPLIWLSPSLLLSLRSGIVFSSSLGFSFTFFTHARVSEERRRRRRWRWRCLRQKSVEGPTRWTWFKLAPEKRHKILLNWSVDKVVNQRIGAKLGPGQSRQHQTVGSLPSRLGLTAYAGSIHLSFSVISKLLRCRKMQNVSGWTVRVGCWVVSCCWPINNWCRLMVESGNDSFPTFVGWVSAVAAIQNFEIRTWKKVAATTTAAATSTDTTTHNFPIISFKWSTSSEKNLFAFINNSLGTVRTPSWRRTNSF